MIVATLFLVQATAPPSFDAEFIAKVQFLIVTTLLPQSIPPPFLADELAMTKQLRIVGLFVNLQPIPPPPSPEEQSLITQFAIVGLL